MVSIIDQHEKSRRHDVVTRLWTFMPSGLRRAAKRWCFLVMCGALSGASAAADYSLLGFGTIGYAVSDMKAPYLRYIDKQGTFRADSLIGLQADVQFDPQWGATVQVVGSAPRGKDNGLETSVRWAFVSYRPSNDWLIRAGRLRPPILNHTQNSEVGLTYTAARLPAEVYSLSPVYDIDGVALERAWQHIDAEYRFTGYVGSTKLRFRQPFQRDSLNTIFPDRYFPEKVSLVGIVIGSNVGGLTIDAGLHRARVQPIAGGAFVDSFVATNLPGPAPLGGTLYVPGRAIPAIHVNVATLSTKYTHGQVAVSTELVHKSIPESDMGIASTSALATGEYMLQGWTPYLTVAYSQSPKKTRALYRQFDQTPVPLIAQAAPLLIAPSYHQSLADGVFVFDQRSLMLGVSLQLNPHTKLKFEWMRTKVGLASALVDGDIHRRRFNVLTMSYNFTF